MEDIDIVFLDMDNTIAENRTCKDIEYYNGMYSEKRPINIVIEAVKEFYVDRGIPVVILSKTLGGKEGKDEKIDWLAKNIDFDLDGIIIIENNRKMKTILEYCIVHKYHVRRALIIDDKKEVLDSCDYIGIQTKYPQQLICDYEAIHRVREEDNGRSIR